jgi:hypothetical protein
LLVALAQGQRLGRLDETAGAVRVLLDIHLASCPATRVRSPRATTNDSPAPYPGGRSSSTKR